MKSTEVSGGSSMVRRSSFEPLPFSSVETLYHLTSSVLPRLNITRYPFAIHSKRIGQYPLVSVDQVRFCGELLFFSSSFFFFFFFPPLGWVQSMEEPTFYLSLFFFLPFFYTSFFLSFFCPTHIFLPLSPCLPSLFYSFPIP